MMLLFIDASDFKIKINNFNSKEPALFESCYLIIDQLLTFHITGLNHIPFYRNQHLNLKIGFFCNINFENLMFIFDILNLICKDKKEGYLNYKNHFCFFRHTNNKYLLLFI